MSDNRDPPRRPEIDLPHHTYQPSRAELNEAPRVDATFEEVVAACLKPVRITRMNPTKPKP